MTAQGKPFTTGALLGLAAGLAALAASAAHADTPGIYYESFANTELAAISLANPTQAVAIRNGNATNIALGGGQVYFQDGLNIYRANNDLSNVTLFHTNGVVATDLAIGAAHGAYYESFAGIELAAIDLANPTQAIAIRNGNATNIAVAGDFVYFEDGLNIYRANWDLSGVTLFHTNGVVATDIDVDAANGILYESFAGIELAAINLADPTQAIAIRNGNATNIALAGGQVYFQDGVNIYRANADLSGVTLFHTNGVAPDDLAVLAPTVNAGGVPEPSVWALMLLGFGGLGVAVRRRRALATA